MSLLLQSILPNWKQSPPHSSYWTSRIPGVSQGFGCSVKEAVADRHHACSCTAIFTTTTADLEQGECVMSSVWAFLRQRGRPVLSNWPRQACSHGGAVLLFLSKKLLLVVFPDVGLVVTMEGHQQLSTGLLGAVASRRRLRSSFLWS